MTERLQARNDRREIVAAGDHDIQVNDRLGGKVGDRGTADVLDADRQWAESGGDAVAQPQEDRRPARVVVHDHDRVGQ